MDHAEHEPGTEQDWAYRATQSVESLVELVRDRSTRPVLFAVQAIVVGLLVSVVGAFLLVAFSVGIVRLLTVDAFGGRVWASDLVVGGIFAASGVFLLKLGKIQRSSNADS